MSKQNPNPDSCKNLINEFDLGMMEKTTAKEPFETTATDGQIDICLPPLLVQAFRSGLEEESDQCNCDCEHGHECTQPGSSSAHNSCGGCNHHD
ncbi:MAG: hypothetical protein J7L25_06695 [Deltaproteobacteria bacterium]|nr:hypothetical protein [Candidatus Tharpella aukensis]